MSRTRSRVPRSGHQRRPSTVQRTRAPAPGLHSQIQRAAIRIGQAGDKYEQEADRVADSVVRKSEADASSNSTPSQSDAEESIQAMPSEENLQLEQTDDDPLQRAPLTSSEGSVAREVVDDGPADIQSQSEIHETEEDKAGAVRRASAEPEPNVQTQSEIHEAEEDKGGSIRRDSHERDADEAVQHNSVSGQGSRPMQETAARAIRDKGEGESLDPATQRTLERHMDLDLSGVRVHRDTRAQSDAARLKAKAFANKNHIWLGPGQSPQDLRLMAHEITHTRQQGAVGSKTKGGSPPAIQRDTTADTETSAEDDVQLAPETGAASAAPVQPGDSDRAPGTTELKGKPVFSPDPAVADWLASKPKGGNVRVRFGSLAEGDIKVKRSGGKQPRYLVSKQSIPINAHPWLTDFGKKIGAEPKLFLSMGSGDKVTGYVGLQKSRAVPNPKALSQEVRANAEAFGLPGFQFPKLPKITNRLEDGALAVEMADVPIRLGRVFDGTFTVKLADEAIQTFKGKVKVSVPGLATGDLEMQRDDKGLITGKANLGVTFPQKNITGDVKVEWDGIAVTGMGKVGYQGEKMSGSITLNLMEKTRAYALTEEKKTPADTEKTSAGSKKQAKTIDSGKLAYVLFGEGDLQFSFTDWLNGTAHVIVDPKGFTTIIGKITPQKEFELFPQTPYNKPLFKREVRARYGLPVVGNVFIFGNFALDAFAHIGPGVFHKIEVNGTYSTDPKKLQDFSIQGTLNVSAAAGLKLRGEAGVGVEVLSHDIKAGAGVNAIAGVKGYTEATPIIGYREKAMEGEDKKGEFYIRGEFEIAAQPFLGLSGDLFVEVDAPWWSPVPDKKWTWPLGSKEYPLGGQLGVGANVDYVFGSGKAPSVDFKKVDFSADKFLTDLYKDKASPKSGAKEPKKGAWKEKNAKAAEPPGKGAEKGGAQQGKLPGQKAAKATVQSGGSKRTTKVADPNAKTASGKRVKDYQKEASKKGRKPEAGKGPKSANAQSASGEKDEARKQELARGLAALQAVTTRYAKDGASLDEVKGGVGSVRRKFKRVFKRITVLNAGDRWDYEYVASPPIIQKGPPQKSKGKAQKDLESKLPGGRKDMVYTEDLPGRAKGPKGHIAGMKNGPRSSLPATSSLKGYTKGDHRGHLVGDRFMGVNKPANLVPMHEGLNLSGFKKFENDAAKIYEAKKGHARLLYLHIKPQYPGSDPNVGAHYRPTKITPVGKLIYLENGKVEDDKVKGSGSSLSNPKSGAERLQLVVLEIASVKELQTIPWITESAAKRIHALDNVDFASYEKVAQKAKLTPNQEKNLKGNYFHPTQLYTLG